MIKSGLGRWDFWGSAGYNRGVRLDDISAADSRVFNTRPDCSGLRLHCPLLLLLTVKWTKPSLHLELTMTKSNELFI